MDRKRRRENIVGSVLRFIGRPLYAIILLALPTLLLLFIQLLLSLRKVLSSVISNTKTVVQRIFSTSLHIVKNIAQFIRTALVSLGKRSRGVKRIVTRLFPLLPTIRLPSISLSPRQWIILLFILGTIAFSSLSGVYILKDLPTPETLRSRQPKLTTHILDRNGNELYKIYKDENRSLVSLNQLPEYLIDATVAIEDKEFWSHSGFSLSGIIRAIRHNAKILLASRQTDEEVELQGGSTITQQLVKNTLLTSEQTLRRKIREAILAVWIEQTFSKEEILQMYLNEVSYGGTAYGIQEASQQYFGKDAGSLSTAEATMLAGLPAAPTTYSPFGSNPERAKERQLDVLRRMVEDKYLDQQRADRVGAEEIVLKDNSHDIKAPHFVMYVRDQLVKLYGEEYVNHGGLRVTTTLDLPVQEFVQKTVTDEVNRLARLHVSNGAALVTHPKTGEILAMVGSKDYFNFRHDGQVNVTIRPRQPGSSIKPVNYAAALQHGFTPASVILDAPISFTIPGSKPYSPVNYDRKFHGPVTVRTALASSYNVPAVKVLSTIGVDTMIDQGEKMGIKTWTDRKRFGLSLTLGGGEITMIDMAGMYGTLANYGVYVPLASILKVEDRSGKLLYQHDQVGTTQALPATVAYQLTDILSDPIARAPAFGTHSVLNIADHQVAVKTGTTNSLRDNWTFGYTTDVVVATWVGNNDNSPMSYIASGITGASPIWAVLMKGMLSTRGSPHVFPRPSDLVVAKICTLTGQLSCEGCPSREEVFLPGTEPKEACRPEVIEEIKKKRDETEKTRDQILEGTSTRR